MIEIFNEKTQYKIIFGFIKNMSIGLLTSIGNISNQTK